MTHLSGDPLGAIPLSICSNMDGPGCDHTKRIESERERQIPYDITHMWNLKYDTNKLMHERETDSQTERADWRWPRRRRSGGGEGWESGISRCKLVYTGYTRSYV